MNWAKQNEVSRVKESARSEARRAMSYLLIFKYAKRTFQGGVTGDLTTVLPLAAVEVR